MCSFSRSIRANDVITASLTPKSLARIEREKDLSARNLFYCISVTDDINEQNKSIGNIGPL